MWSKCTWTNEFKFFFNIVLGKIIVMIFLIVLLEKKIFTTFFVYKS